MQTNVKQCKIAKHCDCNAMTQSSVKQCTAMQRNAKQCKAGSDEAATASTWRPEQPAGPGD
eukprot:5606397-Pyramimonas_sp.AAC.1